MRGTTGQVDLPCAYPDEEQYVDGLKEERLDGKEIAGEHLLPIVA
jgi:hypothetical protein